MKRLIQLGVYLFLLALIVPISAVLAKGPADKITISGPGLVKPIEITEDTALAQFSPWGDKFFDSWRGIIAQPSQVEPKYQVQLILNDENGKPRRVYTFQYVPDSSGSGGYIYLPGPGEAHYRDNVYTIIRGADGSWLYASKDFDSLAREALQANGVSLTPSPFVTLPEWIASPIWLVVLGVVVLLSGIGFVWRRRLQHA